MINYLTKEEKTKMERYLVLINLFKLGMYLSGIIGLHIVTVKIYSLMKKRKKTGVRYE